MPNIEVDVLGRHDVVPGVYTGLQTSVPFNATIIVHNPTVFQIQYAVSVFWPGVEGILSGVSSGVLLPGAMASMVEQVHPMPAGQIGQLGISVSTINEDGANGLASAAISYQVANPAVVAGDGMLVPLLVGGGLLLFIVAAHNRDK